MSRTSRKGAAAPPVAADIPGEKEAASPAARPFGALDAVLLFLCAALLLLIFVAAVLPRLIGCTPYAISSDSMSPILRRGDLVFVEDVDFDALEGGEIVVFQTDSGFVTHRVYSVDGAGRTLRTKADASPYLDALPVTENMLAGRAVYKLPLLGYVSLSLGGEESLT